MAQAHRVHCLCCPSPGHPNCPCPPSSHHLPPAGEEKEAALSAFSSGRVPVLLSTTVVEVGVDVPAASVMVVEAAERFGLAQLHQLRGRVGRGARPATCYLLASTAAARDKLAVLASARDGFEVAELDFQARGAGDLLGRRQSGQSRMLGSSLKVGGGSGEMMGWEFRKGPRRVRDRILMEGRLREGEEGSGGASRGTPMSPMDIGEAGVCTAQEGWGVSCPDASSPLPAMPTPALPPYSPLPLNPHPQTSRRARCRAMPLS